MLKNPFGMRNGKIVMIADLKESERGARCGCVCPYCKAHFVARLGEVRQPHFAHNGKPCDEVVAVMTAAMKNPVRLHIQRVMVPILVYHRGRKHHEVMSCRQ